MAKKTKKENNNKLSKVEKKAEGMAKKCQDVIQSTTFQVCLLIFSIIWLIILILLVIKVRNMTKNFETNMLNDDPFRLINFSISVLGNMLPTTEFKFKHAIQLMERIERISRNSTFDKIMTNVSVNTNIIPKLSQAIADKAEVCISNEGVKLLAEIINTTSILINVADRGLPFCLPNNINKALKGCPNEPEVFEAALNLFKSFINVDDYGCSLKVLATMEKYALNYGKEENNDRILDVIEQNINNTHANKRVCSFISEYSTREDLFSSETKGKICKLAQEYKCEKDNNLIDLCEDLQENVENDFENKEL